MWDDTKRRRFQELRNRESGAKLSSDETEELARLTAGLERLEADYLRVAAERLRSERERIERHNTSLEVLVHRRNSLRDRLQSFLADAEVERRAIADELAALVGTEAPSTPGAVNS